MIIHNGEKPHIYYTCGKDFVEKHENLLHRPHKYSHVNLVALSWMVISQIKQERCFVVFFLRPPFEK